MTIVNSIVTKKKKKSTSAIVLVGGHFENLKEHYLFEILLFDRSLFCIKEHLCTSYVHLLQKMDVLVPRTQWHCLFPSTSNTFDTTSCNNLTTALH